MTADSDRKNPKMLTKDKEWKEGNTDSDTQSNNTRSNSNHRAGKTINEETADGKESHASREDNQEQPNDSMDSDKYKAPSHNKRGPLGKNGATETHYKRTSNKDSDSDQSDNKARTPAGEETEEREAAKAKERLKNMMFGRPGKFQCKTCKKKVPGWRDMERHVKIHIQKPVTCPTCNTRCKTYNGLRTHKYRKHQDSAGLGVNPTNKKTQ